MTSLYQNSKIANVPNIWEDITKAGPATAYNAAVAQEGAIDDYSYEEGYFKAFKVVISYTKSDSDSLVMPAMFIARHFIELTLKDLVFNLSIVFGDPIKISKRNTHHLEEVYHELYKIAKAHELSLLTDDHFSNIICQMEQLSPKSDEYRYPTNQRGKWNFSNNDSHIINLVALDHNLTYFYLVTQSLLILISNSSDSIYEYTIYENSYVIELMKMIVNSHVSADNVRNKITGWTEGDILHLDEDNIEINDIKAGKEVKYNGVNLFTIITQDGSGFLKTNGLILK